MSTINFESMVFDAIVSKHLLYDPKIAIHPAHLANGLFRAVCDSKYTNDTAQHQVLFPKGYPITDVNPFFADNNHASARDMLHTLLNADHRMFHNVNTSSYTLTHASHITNDNHDRGAGEWLHAILAQEYHNDAGSLSALTLLEEVLNEDDQRRSDELSVLTLPLVQPEAIATKTYPSKIAQGKPLSLQTDQNGVFLDPLIIAIRTGFDTLAQHDAAMTRYGRKLDALQRLVRWGCFALYLHLANSGVKMEERTSPIPLVLSIAQPPSQTLVQASIQSYQCVKRSIDQFFRREIHALIEAWYTTGEHGPWETIEQIRDHIQSMEWKKKSRGGKKQATEKKDSHTPRCLKFFEAYCSEPHQTPRSAFADALTDMLDNVFSSNPSDVARTLGVQIGLLSAARKQNQKIYAPHPDLLDLFVRASLAPQQTIKLYELAKYWADTYGLLFGAIGDENDRLAKWGISAVNGTDFKKNADSLAELLENIGYARRYADGVVIVAVKE